ncbi:MAG: FecR domain-containing protein [Verrucomicrobia bacterium]|nr:FecR domain-containing protein [Verrucomicrobiota bacterium]
MSSSPSTPDPTPSPEVIEAAAAAWLSLRDRGMTATETAEFVRWLQQDAQHAAVFSELDAVWKDFDRLGAVATPTPSAAAPDADALAPRPRVRRHPGLALTAVGLAAAVLVAISLVTFGKPHYAAETAVGAFQKFDLPDGSVAQLNTDSAIDTDFTHHERRVRIVRGEVFFTVTKDPARPFIVTSGPVAIRAVGTAFNVRQRAESVEVLVTEGRVRVDNAEAGRSFLPAPDRARSEPPLLVAGERATVALARGTASPSAALATVVALTRPATQRFLAWQERRLEFEAESLDEVVREFNRYNHRKLVIADPRLSPKRFSGTFRADGYESLVRLLEQDFGVAAETREREIVLRSKD